MNLKNLRYMTAIIAVAACGVTIADDSISSANIVGYTTQNYTAKKWNPLGPTFVSVGANQGKFNLGDVIPSGWDWEADELRTLKTSNAGTEKSMFYVSAADFEATGVDVAGWYDVEGNCYNDAAFDLGTGFLTCLYNKIDFTYAGEVYQDEIPLSLKGKKWNIVVNSLPRTIKLGEIVPTGWDWEADELRKLKTENAGTARSMFYVSEADFEATGVDVAGWYDVEGNLYNDEDVNPGDGFLTCIYSDVIITLPAAIEAE